MRIFVQGSHATSELALEEACKLGRLCRDRGVELNLGSQGNLVRALAESGAACHVHHSSDEPVNAPEDTKNVKVVSCVKAGMAAHREFVFRDFSRVSRFAWAARLAALETTSDGFIFFPGEVGTLAHAVPILASIAKNEARKESSPRRVALVGWDREQISALCLLLSIPRPGSRDNSWLASFPVNEVHAALEFVLTGKRLQANEGSTNPNCPQCGCATRALPEGALYCCNYCSHTF